MDIYNLVSFAGLFVLLLLAYALSGNRKAVNFRLVALCVLMQFVVGVVIFVMIAWVPDRFNPFLLLNEFVKVLIEASSKGTEFVFGSLSDEDRHGFIFIVQAIPAIIFFSGLLAILQHIGFLPWLIRVFSSFFSRVLHLSGAESLVGASNIFIGVESSVMVKDFIQKMTLSELTTILSCGMATVASNVLALYVFALQESFPSIAAHLISASILSAPAAFAVSKIIFPETGKPETMSTDVRPAYEPTDSIFEAIINGSNNGMKLVSGIIALLLSVLGLVELVNIFLGWGGGLLPWQFDISLSSIFAVAGYPFALIMGVPPADAMEVGSLLGTRIIETEVPAYFALGDMVKEGVLEYQRSKVIAAYALCGFSHIASVAIFVGGYAALAPQRSKDLSAAGFKALMAATIACFMTACIAGTFYMKGSLIFS